MSNKQTPCHGCDHGWGNTAGESCHDDCPELKAYREAHLKPYKDWTLAEAKAFCAERGQGRKDGYDPCDKCPLWTVLCATEYPEKWWLHAYTPQEVEAAKAVRVLFPTASTIYTSGHDHFIQVFDADGEVIHAFIEDRNPFPSLKKGETVKLDDIIGDGE